MRSWRNGELQAIKIRSGQPSDASHETQDRMPMRCENGGPIADEFGAMFLLGRVLINPILHTAAADVRFAPKATEIAATPRSDVMGQQQTHAAQQTQHAGCKITRSRVRIALHLGWSAAAWTRSSRHRLGWSQKLDQ